MSTRERRTRDALGAVMILLLLAVAGIIAVGNIYGGVLVVPLTFLVVFVLIGVATWGIYKSSSRLAEVDEPIDDPTTGPAYYEETTPKDVESKTPAFSCPDCGYENPMDADFCIGCGRDLDVTDEVARY
ncbi:MAG: zinc-ribbon domain-containing protein [Candidatus Hodarchaeota archaeon]